MKYTTQILEAIFIKPELEKDEIAYLGDNGFICKYWFKVIYRKQKSIEIPFVLDFTAESYEPKYEYWAVFKPMWTYSEVGVSLEEMIGMPFKVLAEIDDYGNPISIVKIVEYFHK